jgi:hypothetical protein
MTMEKTLRSNGKWAKVSGSRGKWACAKGWAGQVAAAQVHYWPTKDGALVSATYWIND